MRIESHAVRLIALFCLSLLARVSGSAQEPAAPAAAIQEPAPATPPQGPPPPPPLPPRSQDYPEPQGFTIGVFYWLTIPGQEPDFKTGKTATLFEGIPDLGKPKQAPGFEVSYPITRTGTLRAEGFQLKGAGSATIPADSAPLGLQYNKGDLISRNYRIKGGKLWLDDLFWPHRFPVARFRLKSILGLEYLQTKASFDAPLKPLTSSITSWQTNGTRQLALPAIGMAAEYAVTPHVLFRAQASGFDWPHGSYFYDGDVSASVHRRHIEVLVGFRALGFRTSPSGENYIKDLIAGGYAGLRWHF